MTPILVRSLRLVVLGLALAGCSAGAPQLVPAPTPTSAAWGMVLRQVSQDVEAGRHAAADRLLLDFQQTHPAAPEAAEAGWYRALFKLDPANGAGAARDGVTLLDGLIATPIVTAEISPRRADALVLRRIATALDARSATAGTVPSTGSGASAASPVPRADDSRARDEEITRLRDELSKANAELERIKRRVATPKP